MNAPLPASVLHAATALDQVSAQWDQDIVAQLSDYIAIPAKSPAFDTDWAQHGHIEAVVRHAAAWVEAQKVPGLTLEVLRRGLDPASGRDCAAVAGSIELDFDALFSHFKSIQ